jgi:hypothetical protein
MERKILAWLSLAVSVIACFPSACLAGLAAVWFAGTATLSTGAIKEFLGWGAPPPEFFGAMVVPMAIGTFIVFALAMTLLIWGARALLRAPANQSGPAEE